MKHWKSENDLKSPLRALIKELWAILGFFPKIKFDYPQKHERGPTKNWKSQEVEFQPRKDKKKVYFEFFLGQAVAPHQLPHTSEHRCRFGLVWIKYLNIGRSARLPPPTNSAKLPPPPCAPATWRGTASPRLALTSKGYSLNFFKES